MVNILRRFRLFVVLLLSVLSGGQLVASSFVPGVDVASLPHRSNLNNQMLWCRSETTSTPNEVLAGACEWQPMSAEDVVGGDPERAAWMRITLLNRSAVPVDRWIKLGYSRTSERSLFVKEGERWSRQDTGMSTPLDRRQGDQASARGYLTVAVPAQGQVEVLLRARSAGWVDLRATLLEPQRALAEAERRELLVLLAVGGLLLSQVFGVLLFARTGQWAYLCFVAALLGETIVELHRAGMLQQRFWPTDVAVPDSVMSIGGFLALSGWASFLVFFFPSLLRYRGSLVVGAVLMSLSVIALLWSIVIDYSTGLRWWGFLFVPTHLYGAYLCWLGIRDVDRFQRVLLWVLMAIFLFAVARVFFAQTIDASNSLLGLTPFGLILGMPIVLFVLLETALELKAQLSRAEAQSAGQLRFLAQMSHELRTPLDTVLGNAQLLLRGGAKMSGAIAQDGLRNIVESARHLLGMIDEILGYARGLSGALSLRVEPTRLADFIHAIEATGQVFSVRNRDRFVLRQQRGSIDISELVVLIDATRLRQVIDNLLVNAARHTREGLVTLEYGAAALDEEKVRLSFSVTDTGEGISPEDQERVFLPFERVGANGHVSGKGLGMGLPIARQLVRAMGGEIYLKSELGQGASFSFDIIAQRGALADVATSFEDGDPIDATGYLGERRSILLVDDEASTRRLLAALLTRLGFRVIELESGRAAAEVLHGALVPDLIITDQFMADGDGWDVLEIAQQTHPDVPTVLVSAAPASPPEGWPLNIGFSASLLKPVDHDVLLRRIGDLLQLQWLRGAPPIENDGAFVRPPVPEMQALAQMIDLGEVTAIREWAMQLRRDYPQCSAFADKVEQAVTLLDFKSLEAMLGRGAA